MTIRLIATGRFKSAISHNARRKHYDNNLMRYVFTHEVLANGPQFEFKPAYTDNGQSALPYYQAEIDTTTDLFKEKYKNFETGEPTSQYDLISGLPTCMETWLNSRNVLIQATESSKKDILKAIKEGKIKKEFVNDDFGVLSSSNKNIRIVQPQFASATSELVIDEIDDSEVSGIDDIETKVAEKEKEAEKKLASTAASKGKSSKK